MSVTELKPEEVENIIIKLYEARQLRYQLERKESEYQSQLNHFLDKNEFDVLEGETLQLTRKTITRLRICKSNLPKEIYQQYAQERSRMSITKKDLPEEIYRKYAQEKTTSVLIIDPVNSKTESDSKTSLEDIKKEGFQKRLKKLDEEKQPDNKGKKWTDLEEDNLLTELSENNTINEIAKKHGRTTGGIATRISQIVYKEINAGESIDNVMNMVKMTKDEIQDIIDRRGKYILQTHKGTHK
jgi:hypothetical protein